jgi:hypothetical protein
METKITHITVNKKKNGVPQQDTIQYHFLFAPKEVQETFE